MIKKNSSFSGKDDQNQTKYIPMNDNHKYVSSSAASLTMAKYCKSPSNVYKENNFTTPYYTLKYKKVSS